MKICQGYEILINQYIDGELDPQLEAEVRAHIEACPACREYYRQLCAVSQSLRDVDIPKDLHSTIMEAIAREEEKPKVIFFRRPAFAASVAAVLVMGLVGIAGIRSGVLGGPKKDEALTNESQLLDVPAIAESEGAQYYAESNPGDRMTFRSYKLQHQMKSWFNGEGSQNCAVYNRDIPMDADKYDGEVPVNGTGGADARLSRLADTIDEDASGEKYGFCMVACGGLESLPEEFASFAEDLQPGGVMVLSVKNSPTVRDEIDRSMSENGFEVFYDEEGEYFTVDAEAEISLVIIELDQE